jgi:hypothetical protein
MLLRNRAPSIDSAPVTAAKGYEHVPASSIAVLRWLNTVGVDYVLVGQAARAARGDNTASGPVAIVPAPYGRNLDRLAQALNAVHARERSHAAMLGIRLAHNTHGGSLKFTASQLLRPERWNLSCGVYELDIEGRPAGSPSFQELLYEAVRVELAEGVGAEVAAPEDIEHYDHVRRTGVAPELVVTRTESAG